MKIWTDDIRTRAGRKWTPNAEDITSSEENETKQIFQRLCLVSSNNRFIIIIYGLPNSNIGNLFCPDKASP